MVDWRESAVDKLKKRSFGTCTHSAEDGKTKFVKEVKSHVFPAGLLDFSHLAKRTKVELLVLVCMEN